MQTTTFRYCLLMAAFLLLNHPNTFAQSVSDSLRIQLEEKYQRAQDLIKTYEFDEALQTLSECYIRDSKNLKYLLKIAYCNEQLGRFKDARLFLKAALKVDSVNREALIALAGIHERSSNTSAAKQLYQELIELDSTNSYYWKRSGYMSIKMGKPYEAVLAFYRPTELMKEIWKP
jgi:tetratricopeptide (TPR) repeat protein